MELACLSDCEKKTKLGEVSPLKFRIHLTIAHNSQDCGTGRRVRGHTANRQLRNRPIQTGPTDF